MGCNNGRGARSCWSGPAGPWLQAAAWWSSWADAERFVAEARDPTVVDVDADYYSILISLPAISADERFVGAGAA